MKQLQFQAFRHQLEINASTECSKRKTFMLYFDFSTSNQCFFVSPTPFLDTYK